MRSFRTVNLVGLGTVSRRFSSLVCGCESNGIAVAGRTILHSILDSLDRIAFNGDPLKFLLIETSYQPFIALFHMLGFTKEYPELAAIRW